MKQLLCSVLAFGLVTAVSPAAVCATEGTEPPAAYYEAVQTDTLANWPWAPSNLPRRKSQSPFPSTRWTVSSGTVPISAAASMKP